jgi:iron complex outermembrane recepter protein
MTFPTRRAVRLSLLAAAIPTLVLGAEEAANTGAEEVLEEQVVTGSRITRLADQSPNPVMTITAADIAQSGQTNLTQFLADTPQLVSSITTTDSSGSSTEPAGINLLNLRNLGTDRTLVLVNGRRHIAGVPGSAAVDINSIPTDLLERVDVLTGGVSAIYGADGVSGVVNFVTRRNFEGLNVHGQYGLSGKGDADNTFLAVTGGKNFADGRGNVALAYEFTGDGVAHGRDRARGGDPLRSYSFAFNPDDPDDEPGLYDRIPVNNLRWAGSSPDGAIDVDGDLVADFRGGGQPYDPGVEYPGTGWTQGGSGTPLAGYFGDLQAKTRKHVFNLLGSFEVSDNVHAFFEGKYATTKTWNLSQPTFEVYTIAQADNPFIPATIRSAIAPDALDTLFRDFGIIDEDDPQVIPDGVLITRDNLDLSIKGDTVTRDTVRSVLGIDGKLFDKAKYELSYTFGQSKIAYDQPGHRINERFFAALDAVDEGLFVNGTANGNIRCRIDLQPQGTVISPYNVLLGNLVPGGDGSGAPQTFSAGANSGCVPLNVFGEGVADPDALEWIGYRIVDRAKVNQHVLSGYLSGDSADFFELPGGALGWAAGAEYRKEKSVNRRDPILSRELLWGYANVTDEVGSFNVKETFAEVTLPLLRDHPAAKALTLGGAIRLSDYSTVGTTTTWKTDVNWIATNQFSVRGTYSEAVRAPNIGELFAPRTGVFGDIYDPCDVAYVDEGNDPARRAANCADILGALGVDPGTFNPSSNPQFATTTQPGRAGGNAALLEEKAKTWTAGLTIRPEFAPSFVLGLDWYDIKLTNAISTASAQEVINLCVDSPRPNNYCDSVTRLTGNAGTYTTGFISSFLVGPQNVARYSTSGMDISVNWAFAPAPEFGRFQLKANAGYLKSLNFIALPGAAVDDDRLDQWAPKWTLTGDLVWHRGSLMLDYGLNYFSKTRRFNSALVSSQPDVADPKYLWFKPKVLHDLQGAWQLVRGS